MAYVEPRGEGPSHRKPRVQRWPRRVVVAVSVTLALALIAGASLYGYARYRFSQVHKVAIPSLQHSGSGTAKLASGSNKSAAPPPKTFNVLLAGVDSIGGGKRADTMIIARVDASTGHLALLSIPYDYFAPIAGTNSSNKISDALSGGPERLIATIEQDLKIPISHYVQVSFGGVVKMINSLGGVRLDFPYPALDKMSGLYIPKAGCQRLNGTMALHLVRSRFYEYYKNGSWHYDPTAGFGRIHRQQAFMRAVVQRAQGSILSNPLRLNSFIGTAVHEVTIDNRLSLSQLAHLALDFRHLGGSSLTTYTLPTKIVNNYGPYGDVLFPVPSLDSQVINQFMASTSSSTSPSTPASTSASKTSAPPTTSSPPAKSSPSDIATPPGAAAAGGAGSIVTNSPAPSWDPTPCS